MIYKQASSLALKLLDLSVSHSAWRLITSDVYGTHHCVLFDKAGWSPLQEGRDTHWYLFIYTDLPGKLP